MSSSDPLLQPYQLKHLSLRNRIMSTAHEPAYSEGGLPGERYRLYHVEKAKGGIALTMTAGSAIVSADSPPAFGNLHAYRDEIVAPLRALTEACHDEGTAVMIQLTHLGRRTSWNKADWLPVLAPSPVREPAHRAFPKEMEDWDIARIVGDYALAAQRMKEAGLDGIELECYGHLIDGFWSPATNHRDDDYNGSLENRLRFAHQVFGAIRDAVGPDFIVGARLVADEDWDKGLSREDGLEICQRLVAGGDVDFLNIIRGHIESDASLSRVIPVQGMRSAPHLDFAGEVRAQTKFPIFHAARINDVATARHAIAEGKLDMVGMTRAHLADPHIARKVATGQEDQIRPCVGATYCLDRIYEGGEALCIHNPATGREATIPHQIAKSDGPAQRIVVVGAGPAGLEAARALGQRGYDVTLAEAGTALGGRVALEAALPGLSEWRRVADYREYQISQMANVEVYLDSALTAEQVLEFGADHVVIATGAKWCDSGVGRNNDATIPRSKGANILTVDALMAGATATGPVVIFDDDHYYMGGVLAELLRGQGHEVTLVTPAADVSHWTHNTLEQGRIQKRLIEMDVTILPLHNVSEIEAGEITVECVYTGRKHQIACATFVPVTMRRVTDALYHGVVDILAQQGSGPSVVRIGDCYGPGTIAAAVYGGHRYARELGEPASDATPFRRELPRLAAD
jgi:2,4-dienoyl-CoA reductase-like NADH-dependent reductase (Old Yellow Enzyme family)